MARKMQLDTAIVTDMKAVASDSFKDNIRMIEVDKIKPCLDNFYSIGEIEMLADDIERQGLKHNLVVTEDAENTGYYFIKSGHRRFTAIQHLISENRYILTGQKWYSNKKSLSDIRKESDKLCLKNGLSIIDTKSKYKGIDRTTYQLGLQGKSWKIQLVKDLEQAAKYCHSKDEFIRFLTERDYTVRYKDIHITITKNGEKKGIRVDTLAKQFGEKFQ